MSYDQTQAAERAIDKLRARARILHREYPDAFRRHIHADLTLPDEQLALVRDAEMMTSIADDLEAAQPPQEKP